MAAALIVAGLADAEFAEQVRAQTRGLAIEILPALPANALRPVLLVWSAARPVTARDTPTLLELSVQGRLVIARRDATPLPSGLPDRQALPAGASAREAAFRLLQAALAPGQVREAPSGGSSPSAPPVAVRSTPVPPAAGSPSQRVGVAWLVVALVVVLTVAVVILGSLALY